MRLFGLIGFPLEHSFSKLYFDEKFKSLNRENKFELFPIKSIDNFIDLLKQNPLLKGLAVTIPYKVSVINFLDELDTSAIETGAVNCIKISGNTKGYNTDITGFERSLFSLPILHKKFLVLGDGGASKAVIYILKKNNFKFLQVARNFNPHGILYSEVNESIIKDYPVIINCTSLGMFPNINTKPEIPYQLLSPENLLFDLVYNPAKTAFMREGELRGAIVKNGLEMLQIQAEENWRIWNE